MNKMKLYNLVATRKEGGGIQIQKKDYTVRYLKNSFFYLLEEDIHVNSNFINELKTTRSFGHQLVYMWCDEEHLEELVKDIPNAIFDAIDKEIEELEEKKKYLEEVKKELSMA